MNVFLIVKSIFDWNDFSTNLLRIGGEDFRHINQTNLALNVAGQDSCYLVLLDKLWLHH